MIRPATIILIIALSNFIGFAIGGIAGIKWTEAKAELARPSTAYLGGVQLSCVPTTPRAVK